MFDWVIDIIRTLFFAIAEFSAFLADTVFDTLKLIINLDFGGFNEVWAWYGLLIVFVGSFTIIRVSSMYMKALFNDEYRDTKYKPFSAITGVIMISVVLAFTPLVFKTATSISQTMIENISVFLNVDDADSLKPSTIIASSLVNGLSGKEVTDENKETYTIQEIAQKLNEKKDGKYIYLPELWQIIFVVATFVVFGIGMCLLVFQFAKRFYGLIMKIIIAPVPVSSLVNDDSESFGMWVKMIASDLITNFVQYELLFIVLLTATNQFITSLGFFVSVVMLLGGLLFILEGVPQISQLIGGDTSTGGIMQQLSTIRMATNGIGRSFGNMMSSVGGAALTAGAFGVYSTGRVGGAKSMLTPTTTMNRHNHESSKYFNLPNTDQPITKENSFFNKMGQKASHSAAGRFIAKTGKHMYLRSANRLKDNTMGRRFHNMNEFKRDLKQEKERFSPTNQNEPGGTS